MAERAATGRSIWLPLTLNLMKQHTNFGRGKGYPNILDIVPLHSFKLRGLNLKNAKFLSSEKGIWTRD